MKKVKLSEVAILKGTSNIKALKSQSDTDIENMANKSQYSKILSVTEISELKRAQK